MIVKAEKRKDYLQEEHIIEEVLERIWTAEEECGKAEKVLLYEKFGKEITDNNLCDMASQKLIKIHDSDILLTETGKSRVFWSSAG